MKFSVDNIEGLKNEDMKRFNASDIIVTNFQGMEKAYLVSLKADTKMILCFMDEDAIETITYEKRLLNWKCISKNTFKLNKDNNMKESE